MDVLKKSASEFGGGLFFGRGFDFGVFFLNGVFCVASITANVHF